MSITLKHAILFAFLFQPDVLFVNGDDLVGGPRDYEQYHDLTDLGKEGQPFANGTLTVEEVKFIIDQAVEDARRKVLTDPELSSFITAKIKTFMNSKQECIKKDGYYYDYGVPDCKSCLHENCKDDQLCETECRNFLRHRELKQKNEGNEQEIDAIKSDVKDLQDDQNAMKDADHTWEIVLTVVVGVLLVLIGILIYLVKTRTRSTDTESLTRTFHPLSDIFAEGRRLLGFGRDQAGDGDRNQA